MRSIVVGTAGHIDHGKSRLVRALTGIDPDRLKEEQARGITIELGFAHAVIDDARVAFVDVPGHERFVRTMLAGVGGIDCVLLVVACDESVMPQTREHFDICRLLHVPRGLVVLTKADLVDHDTRGVVAEEVRELVAGSFLEAAPVVAVSSATGEGLDELRTLIGRAARQCGARPLDGAARLPIDRVFTMKGFGTVVTGTLVAGRVRVDEELALVPGGRMVKVRGLQVHGAPTGEAVAGQRVAVNLGGVEVSDLARGQTLAAPGSIGATRIVEAEVTLLPGAAPLGHGARVRVHQGTSEVLGRVSVVGPSARDVAPGQRALVRLRLEAPAALTRGDRFILRAYSPPMTLAGGRVLDPAPRRAGVRSAAALSALERLEFGGAGEAGDDPAAIEAMVDEAGLPGIETAAMVPRAGARPAGVPALVKALVERGRLVAAGDRLVSAAAMRAAGDALIEAVTAFHQAHPLSEGLPREEARERVFANAPPIVFETTVQRLAAAGRVAGTDRLRLSGRVVAVSGEEARVKAAIETAYRAGGLTPADAAAIVERCAAPAATVERLTMLLVREKVLVRLGTLVFHAEAIERLKADVRALKASTPGGRATVDVAAFKTRYGVTRKFAIPLLEHLDRERVTRRTGDVRLVL